MTKPDARAAAAAFRALIRQVARYGASLAGRWHVAAEQRRSIAALHALSDRSLKDLGLCRSEIASVAIHGRHQPQAVVRELEPANAAKRKKQRPEFRPDDRRAA
jgi:uncharacterized protein YjiS (DUF1127 family)